MIACVTLQDDSFEGKPADMWALGVSFFMLLTARVPFGICLEHDSMQVCFNMSAFLD